MARPATWDEREVLAAAMAVFRQKGFARASLRELERATGLHPGSLYHAYGSKAGVFEAALRAYNEHVVIARIERHILQAEDPLTGLEAFFRTTFEARPAPDPGCLVTNSAIDSPALDPAARAGVAAGLGLVRDALRGALVRARADGRIAAAAPVGELADRLLALYLGLLVLVRFGAPTATLAAVTSGVHSVVQPIDEQRGVTR